MFAAVGAVLTFAGGAYRPMVKKRSEVQLLRFGLVLMIAGLAAVGLVALAAYQWKADGTVSVAQLKTGFYVSISVAVIGFAFVNPSVSALVSKRSDPTRQGEVLGVNLAFSSLGRILGPFLGSVLFQAEVSRTLPYVTAVVTLVLVGALLLPKVQPAPGAETGTPPG